MCVCVCVSSDYIYSLAAEAAGGCVDCLARCGFPAAASKVAGKGAVPVMTTSNVNVSSRGVPGSDGGGWLSAGRG